MAYPVTGREKVRRQYIREVQNLVVYTANEDRPTRTQHDAVWKEWLECKYRSNESAISLIQSDVSDAYKARALATLFSPGGEFSPFAQGIRSHIFVPQPGETLSLSALPMSLHVFVTQLLQKSLSVIHGSRTGEDDRFDYLMRRFIAFAIQALELITERDGVLARELFDLCMYGKQLHLLDTAETPTLSKLLVAGIPEKWKIEADSAARPIALADLEKFMQRKPSAFLSYVACVQEAAQSGFAAGKLPYSRRLFASQVRFLLRCSVDANYYVFLDHWIGNTRNILWALEGEAYTSIRHRLVTLLMSQGNSLDLNSVEGRMVAEMILEEFGDSDRSIGDTIRGLFSERREELRKVAEYDDLCNKREAAILARMK